ncbi:MAG TPA: hypothetical protein VG253_12565 [Streptosporangiaceae bacterium]|jgi:hypothetical protein|nr:hypothetical protein [Streptosporangiaceae bacterium]
MLNVSIILGAVTASGAYLRWAALPVVAAYRVGRTMGRRIGGRP